MGKTILCNSCKSTFNEDILKKRNNEDICPVCGESLLNENDSIHNEPLSFGDGVELGENDSFDEDKIDFWWYEIDKNNTHAICTKCGTYTTFTSPVAKVGDYALINHRHKRACNSCGNELRNYIFSKRPKDWIDPRKNTLKDYSNLPKCPTCGSIKIHKISMTNKVTSAIAFGIFAAGHVSKTWKCDICGSKF